MTHDRESVPAAGVEPGQRQLNGPQTTGRELPEPLRAALPHHS